MSALLDFHPDPGHPGVVVAGVHEALDSLGDVELAPGEYAAVVAECARARSRLQSLELRLIAAAKRAQVPQQAGPRSADFWLAKQTRSGQAQSARDARLARELDDTLSVTSSALASGEVSAHHAAVIADATRRLPQRLTREQVATVESSSVEKAKGLDPEKLRRVARRALAAVVADAGSSMHTRTGCWSTRRRLRMRALGSPSTTTATAPPRATSPSPPSRRRCCARSSTR